MGVGVPLIAVAIIRSGELPKWLGWAGLLSGVIVAYLGTPLLVLQSPVGWAVLSAGFGLFFLWFIGLGVCLLFWRPRSDAA
jgi:hypothetical protein